MTPPDLWRSLLFVPAHMPRFVEAAPRAGADAYILDLEDSVPDDQKALARSSLPTAVARISESGAAVLARINSGAATLEADVEAAINSGVHAIVAPKIGSCADLQRLAAVAATMETRAELPIGGIGVIGQIEDLDGLAALDEICRSPRLIGLSLGSEDFSRAARMRPTVQTLYHPNQLVAFACRRYGLTPFGFPGSIADYSDLDSMSVMVALAADLGFAGAFCIHPKQVAVLNRGFSPRPEALADAARIVAAYEQGLVQGRGAVQLEGRMIDAPVAARARAILQCFGTSETI
ncbi:HpcH/HpaI aldolase/citrate lyase family protein [Brevundimonas abyssalis]|uniref:HpcH/HpaI aldolase/citrate lyase family protein n=1 Tax=Brevundimonas abyssalis TaxID=1125965 RepID=UPI0005EC2870|nr:CoA ester lyase [Brevundimonas abyssalis]